MLGQSIPETDGVGKERAFHQRVGAGEGGFFDSIQTYDVTNYSLSDHLLSFSMIFCRSKILS